MKLRRSHEIEMYIRCSLNLYLGYSFYKKRRWFDYDNYDYKAV